MNHTRIWATALVLMLATGACAEETEQDSPPQDMPVADTDAADAAQPDTAGDGAILRVDTLAGVGPYLTDQSGRALYLIEGAPEGQSTCYDACAEEWPPFLAPEGAPQAGAPPVQSGLIGTLERRDGSTQVTYGGHALYYYHDDRRAGQTTGQDVTDQWGEWYLVRPDGEHLESGGGA